MEYPRGEWGGRGRGEGPHLYHVHELYVHCGVIVSKSSINQEGDDVLCKI